MIDMAGIGRKKLPAAAGAALTLSGGADMAIAGNVYRVKLASVDAADLTEFAEISGAGCPIGKRIVRWRALTSPFPVVLA